jgi:hypothetical protein
MYRKFSKHREKLNMYKIFVEKSKAGKHLDPELDERILRYCYCQLLGNGYVNKSATAVELLDKKFVRLPTLTQQ